MMKALQSKRRNILKPKSSQNLNFIKSVEELEKLNERYDTHKFFVIEMIFRLLLLIQTVEIGITVL